MGCGSGVAVTELAAAFPRSAFVGIDPSPTAIQQARLLAKDAGLANVEFRVGRAEELPEPGRYDFAMVLDCIHDMTRPQEAMRALRRELKDDGFALTQLVQMDGRRWRR